MYTNLFKQASGSKNMMLFLLFQLGPHTTSKACGRRHIHIIIAVVAVAVVFVIFIAATTQIRFVVASLKATAGTLWVVSVPRLPRAAVASLMAGRSSTVRDAAQSRAESSDAAGGRGAFIVRMCVCVCLPVQRVRGRLWVCLCMCMSEWMCLCVCFAQAVNCWQICQLHVVVVVVGGVLVLSPHVLDVCFCMFLILNYVVRPCTCTQVCLCVCVWTTRVVVFASKLYTAR